MEEATAKNQEMEAPVPNLEEVAKQVADLQTQLDALSKAAPDLRQPPGPKDNNHNHHDDA